MRKTAVLVLLAGVWCVGDVIAQVPREVTVQAPTRLDWEFPAKGFGAGAGKLPAGYKSEKQRYQFFAPAKADPTKPMPLILFISAGDHAEGWKYVKPICESEGVLFAAPMSAGNSTPAGQRLRILLDVLDDVRRKFKVDADQTYVTGFSGGGRMACSLAFSLPEYFGGAFPICGTNPLPSPAYLRHRVRDRLSVAFLTGEKDFNRKENEVYMQPWFAELGVRSKAWVVPKVGHVIPSDKVLAEVYAWLKDDLARRRADRKVWPELNVEPGEGPSAAEQAKNLVAAAKKAFEKPDQVWRGVTMLQGVTQRFDKTEASATARQFLKEVANNEAILNVIEKQGAEDEVRSLSAQAKALTRFGQTAKAIEAWELLRRNYEGTPIAEAAQKEIRMLQGKK